MKELIRDSSGPSHLIALEPDKLAPLGAEIQMPEASIARLSAEANTVYVIGEHTGLRYHWDARASLLRRDDAWNVRYRTLKDQSYGWDVVLEGGQAWFMDNGDHLYEQTMKGKGVE